MNAAIFETSESGIDDAFLILVDPSAGGPYVTTVGSSKGWMVCLGQMDFNRQQGKLLPTEPGGYYGGKIFRSAVELALEPNPFRLHCVCAKQEEGAVTSLLEKSSQVWDFIQSGGKVRLNDFDITDLLSYDVRTQSTY